MNYQQFATDWVVLTVILCGMLGGYAAMTGPPITLQSGGYVFACAAVSAALGVIAFERQREASA